MIKIKLALFLFVLSTSSFSASEEQSTIIWATASQMWPPIFYQKQDGEFAGLSYEIADLVFKQKLNLELEVNLFPWKRAQYNVREGNADFLVTLPTPERLEIGRAHV